jgi:hypothetical protein
MASKASARCPVRLAEQSYADQRHKNDRGFTQGGDDGDWRLGHRPGHNRVTDKRRKVAG